MEGACEGPDAPPRPPSSLSERFRVHRLQHAWKGAGSGDGNVSRRSSNETNRSYIVAACMPISSDCRPATSVQRAWHAGSTVDGNLASGCVPLQDTQRKGSPRGAMLESVPRILGGPLLEQELNSLKYNCSQCRAVHDMAKKTRHLGQRVTPD